MSNLATNNADKFLDKQFEELRGLDLTGHNKTLIARINKQVKAEKRQVLAALAGFCLSIIASVIFIFKNDPFGKFALPIVAGVFLFAAIHSARRNNRLSRMSSKHEFVSVWDDELSRKVKEIKFIGPLMAFLFAVLTAFVIHLHGINNFKSWSYLLMCGVITVYVLYQILMSLPVIKDELSMLQELQKE